MPKASEVAAELRKLADSLEQEPDAEISQPWVTFWPSRESFLALARVLPRPFAKKYERDTIQLIYGASAGTPIYVRVEAQRTAVCRVVKPAQEAVYECEPLLSEAAEAQIGGAA